MLCGQKEQRATGFVPGPEKLLFVAQFLYLLMVKIVWMVPKKQRSSVNLILAETAIARLINLNQFCFEHKPTLRIFEVLMAVFFS